MSREFNDVCGRMVGVKNSCPIVNHIMSSTWQGKQKITAIVHLNNTVHLASDTWDLNLCRIVSKVVSGYVLISQLSEQLLTDVLHSSFLKFSWAGRGIHGVCSFLNALLFDGYLSTCARSALRRVFQTCVLLWSPRSRCEDM